MTFRQNVIFKITIKTRFFFIYKNHFVNKKGEFWQKHQISSLYKLNNNANKKIKINKKKSMVI